MPTIDDRARALAVELGVPYDALPERSEAQFVQIQMDKRRLRRAARAAAK